jgi:dTMP kinase
MPLIVFEGLDGCGKTTLMRGIEARLRERACPPVMLREPGSTVLGERLRSFLLDPGTGRLLPWTEALLFTAARAEMVGTQLIPALQMGRVVLLDRYYYSTLAYQGYGFGEDPQPLLSANLAVCRGALADCVLYLRISIETSLQRRGRTPDRMESRDLSYMDRVREGYEQLVLRDEDRFHVLDGEGSPEQVLEQAWVEIARRIGMDS